MRKHIIPVSLVLVAVLALTITLFGQPPAAVRSAPRINQVDDPIGTRRLLKTAETPDPFSGVIAEYAVGGNRVRLTGSDKWLVAWWVADLKPRKVTISLQPFTADGQPADPSSGDWFSRALYVDVDAEGATLLADVRSQVIAIAQANKFTGLVYVVVYDDPERPTAMIVIAKP